MANPKNPGYKLILEATADPDVVRVIESDDLRGPAPVRNVSAVEAGRLHAAAAAKAAEVPPVKKPAARRKK